MYDTLAPDLMVMRNYELSLTIYAILLAIRVNIGELIEWACGGIKKKAASINDTALGWNLMMLLFSPSASLFLFFEDDRLKRCTNI